MSESNCGFNEKTGIIKSIYVPEVKPNVNLASFLLDKLEANGDREVLVDGPSGRSWTGSQLRDAVIRVAQAFVNDFDLKSGEPVAFFCPNSDHHVIGQLAVIAAGGVYTGCYPTYPYRELYNRIIAAQPVFLVACSENLPVAEQVAESYGKLRKLFVLNPEDGEDGDDKNLAPKPLWVSFQSLLNHRKVNAFTKIPSQSEPHQMAALMFSSGSTGQPKMVINSHSNLVSQCVDYSHPLLASSNSSDVTTLQLPICHMGGLFCLIAHLTIGTKLVVIKKFEVENYLKLVDKYKVTLSFAIPSDLLQVTRSPLLSKYDITSLRRVITGGTPLPEHIAQQITRKLRIKNISQVFASTETGVVSIKPRALIDSRTIGTLLPGVEVKIVDPDTGLTLGPNHVGEIYVKGPQVTPGYHKNEAATESAFSADGFYKTGDACFFNEQGLFFIVDRYKELIKFDTQQVAPNELESILLDHRSVAEVAVVGLPDELHGQIPKAYVVLKEGEEGKTSPSSLLDYVHQQVAECKQLRGGLELVEELPKIVGLSLCPTLPGDNLCWLCDAWFPRKGGSSKAPVAIK